MGRKHHVSLDMLKTSDSTISGNMSATITSRVIDVSQLDVGSIHCTFAAGPTGEFSVQARNSHLDTWYTLNFEQPLLVANTDTDVQIIFNEMQFDRLRLIWTPSNAVASNLVAIFASKTVGA